MDDMTVAKIGYVLMVLGIVGFYMSVRYLKILIVSERYREKFYKIINIYFEESSKRIKSIQNELREMLGEDGELIDKSKEEEWKIKMKKIEEHIAFTKSLVDASTAFNEHIKRANSNALWDWWKVNVNVEEYILKDASTFLIFMNKRK